MRYHICMVAGGTGGHMMPAQAVSEQLTALGHRVSLVTDKRGDAFKTIMRGYPRTVLKTGYMSSSGPLGKIQLAINLVKSFFQCRKLFKDDKPDVIIGFGGYPSLPGVRAAASLGIKTILHEQNGVLGRSNRVLARKADAIALSFDNTLRLDPKFEGKATVTGNPIRPEITQIGDVPYPEPHHASAVNILVVGGSLGARILSSVVSQTLDTLKQEGLDIAVCHQARAEDETRVKDIYKHGGIDAEVAPFFPDMVDKLRWSHLIISRAGASSVLEAASARRPAIFIPLSIATDDHQRANAESVTGKNGGWLILEKEFSIKRLLRVLRPLLSERNQLKQAADAAHGTVIRDADKTLAAMALSLAEKD